MFGVCKVKKQLLTWRGHGTSPEYCCVGTASDQTERERDEERLEQNWN